jgi:hypothetical protein
MQTKLFFRLILPLLLMTLACSLAGVSPTPAVDTQATQEAARFSVDKLKADYIYTSELITVIYPLYGSKLDDFVIVTLTNGNNSPAKMVVESEITGYTTKAINTVEVPAGESLEVRQNPRLIPEAIEKLESEKLAQVHLRVVALQEGDEKPVLDETAETTLYARRDFPWAISGFTEAEVYQLLAAMVTPTDPAVEELIRKAADYTKSGIIWGGYGDHVNDDDGGVWDRLQALWQAENTYNLTYVSTTVTFVPGNVQRIRFPAEVLEERSGNCIELAMLYAAAAEALHLEAAIVLVPGHAYVGIREDQQNANYYFIETTMIGRASFDEAVSRAKAEFEEALPHIDAGETSYGWVKIWDARADGISPLPWR